MVDRLGSGALLGHVFTLEDGTPLRLRLARSSDAPALKALLRHRGGAELEVARLVHFDPRRRYVVCATGLRGGIERLLGVGAISLSAGAAPDLLVVAEGGSAVIAELLSQALLSLADARSRAA